MDTGTDPQNPDSDGDGLSDGVENPEEAFVDAQQPGTDPNNDDSDGDGSKDGVEITNGTDPTAPQIPANILSIMHVSLNREVKIAWASARGLRYTVEKSLDLLEWTPLVIDYPDGGAAGDELSFTDAAAIERAAFYRVLQN